jgi:filamentous hemagglutinin family protein
MYYRILALILLSLSVKRKVLLFKSQTDVWTLPFDRCGLLNAATSLVLGGAITCFGNRALAQITPDATLGDESSVVTPNAIVKGRSANLINGGAIRNTNLFHSFSQFNVGNGQRVYFANPSGIENIVGRVTGTDPSDILGTLGVNGEANLFLLNPNGIIVGPNAS